MVNRGHCERQGGRTHYKHPGLLSSHQQTLRLQVMRLHCISASGRRIFVIFRNGLTEVSTYAEIPVPLVYTQVRYQPSIHQSSNYFSPMQVVHLGRFRVPKYSFQPRIIFNILKSISYFDNGSESIIFFRTLPFL